jgi:hypothetical protein
MERDGGDLSGGWDCVHRSVQWLVEDLAHRDLSGVTALGIDELDWGKAPVL